MIKVKTSSNMFRMQISTQTDNQNLRKSVATRKNHILKKNGIKVSKP